MKQVAREKGLRRSITPMPSFVRSALTRQRLMTAYRSRPAYQQNDYLSWISRAKLEPTRQKHLAQMLEELKVGGVYMKMKWTATRR
jgi:hypothetical protein